MKPWLTVTLALIASAVGASANSQSPRPSSVTSGEAGYRAGCSVARGTTLGDGACGEIDLEWQKARDAENDRLSRERAQREEQERKEALARQQNGRTPQD